MSASADLYIFNCIHHATITTSQLATRECPSSLNSPGSRFATTMPVPFV